MYQKVYKKVPFLKEQPEMIRIAMIYRYISLFITSTFYIFGDLNHSTEKKVFIVTCMTISSIIIGYLYIKNQNFLSKIMVLVSIETIGNLFILIPSGGLQSPYVWYSLNTILMASIKLNRKYCWINLLIYLVGSTYISQLILEDSISIFNIITKESNLILSFILITGIIQLLSKYTKKIEDKSIRLIETNKQLKVANRKIKESMNHIMELYRAVHLFAAQEKRSDLIKVIINHSKEIVKTSTIIFIHKKDKDRNVMIESNGLNEDLEEVIGDEILRKWHTIINCEIPLEIDIKNKKFLVACIQSNFKIYGILGIEVMFEKPEAAYKEMIEQLKFLTNLSAITLEKFELEQLNEGLLINQEQNRIANEIHDGILQRLFSISCGMFATIKKFKQLNSNQIEAELNIIRSSINNVMNDLRATIYGFSWKKDGINNFIVNIQNYISEMKQLNNINIRFDVEGNDEILPMLQKKALYRIVCEGIGNAVRHGKAEDIEVMLSMTAYSTSLTIIDKGIGFDPRSLEKGENTGLGVKNIYQLVHSLNGNMNITSRIGEGTRLDITIPNNVQENYKEEAV